MFNKIITIISVTIIFFTNNVSGQCKGDSIKYLDTLKIYSQSFEYSFERGLQVNKSYPILKDGHRVQTTVHINIANNVFIGPGIGLSIINDDYYIPLYLNMTLLKRSESSSPLISVCSGYSYGWNDDVEIIDNYDFKGGFFSSFGIGYKIRASNKTSFAISIHYVHQKSKIIYTVPSIKEFTTNKTTDLFSFRTSVTF